MSQDNKCVRATIRIDGMHCASCEILLERKLRALQGVTQASLNYKTGIAKITADADHPPSEKDIERAVKSAGYSLADGSAGDTKRGGARKWLEIGASLIIIYAIFSILSTFHIVSIAPSTAGALSFGGIFVIGLVAGTSSCLAVTGSLLLAAAAKYNEAHHSETRWEKFRPLLQFNIGRIVSYFVLGGIVGLIGQSLTLTPFVTGILNIVIALVMLSIALSILNIMPKGLGIKPPKRLSHWIHGLAENPHPVAPFILGGLTFFLPCGFTQSLQLVALASGSFWTGAMTMFVFALGTLPALLSISAISSTATGGASRIFLRFAGTLVLVLALYNLNSAIALTGFDTSSLFASPPNVADDAPAPAAQNGVQEVAMRVEPEGYQPDALTVRAGIPVRWTVDGTDAGGCGRVIVIPSLGITRVLASGPNVIEFTPQQKGKLLFSCSMGMYRGHFNVL